MIVALVVVLVFNLLVYALVARRIEDLLGRLACMSMANTALAIFGTVMGFVCRANVGAWYC